MILETRQTRAKGKGLFTTGPVQQGIPLVEFVGKLDLSINHSCRPNGILSFGKIPVLHALRPIDQGEELTYNYATSEYEAQNGSFECRCGERGCYSRFRGFKYLLQEEKIRILSLVSPFIAMRMKQEGLGRVYPIKMAPEQLLPSIVAPRAS